MDSYFTNESLPMLVILPIRTTDFSLNLHTFNVLKILSNSKDCHDHEGYTHRILENTCIKFTNLLSQGIINEHVLAKQVRNTFLDVKRTQKVHVVRTGLPKTWLAIIQRGTTTAIKRTPAQQTLKRHAEVMIL
jgi:hypothetical protein